jgi:hypothetical protein
MMDLEPEAASLFEDWMKENAAGLGDAASLYKGFCGKLGGTVLRLALVSELIGWADSEARQEPSLIRWQTVAAVIDFVEAYAKPTAMRVFGDAALPQVERDAAAVARVITKDALNRVNTRQLREAPGLHALRTGPAIEDAIAHLVEADWLRQAPEPDSRTGGRPRKDYLVNPAVHGGQA